MLVLLLEKYIILLLCSELTSRLKSINRKKDQKCHGSIVSSKYDHIISVSHRRTLWSGPTMPCGVKIRMLTSKYGRNIISSCKLTDWLLSWFGVMLWDLTCPLPCLRDGVKNSSGIFSFVLHLTTCPLCGPLCRNRPCYWDPSAYCGNILWARTHAQTPQSPASRVWQAGPERSGQVHPEQRLPN